MIFWLSAGNKRIDYPRQLIPWYIKPKSMVVEYMIDAGVTQAPPTIDDLVATQKGAAVAVAPDILGDPKATRERAKAWLVKIKKASPHSKRALCTQGTMKERADLVKHFADEFDIFGAGLGYKTLNVMWTPFERRTIITELTPLVHTAGAQMHVFGTGCTGGVLDVMLKVGVDAFDSTSPLLVAVHGKVFDYRLRQIHIGGEGGHSGVIKRLRVNLGQIQHCISAGVPEAGVWDWCDPEIEEDTLQAHGEGSDE